ncbi:MAG: HepT-like ribonuclease domain-containing protein [Bryobacterales bacterium]
MSRREPRLALEQMLAHSLEALSFVEGRTRRDLDTDRLLSLALVRLVEVIGEAASRIPEADRHTWPQIPWRQIIGTRHRLIHGYDAVDHDILWAILSRDLPDLVEALEVALSS